MRLTTIVFLIWAFGTVVCAQAPDFLGPGSNAQTPAQQPATNSTPQTVIHK